MSRNGERALVSMTERRLGRPLPELATLSAERRLRVSSLAGDMLDRWQLAQKAGLQFGTERNIFETLGYKRTPRFSDYLAYWDRDPTARRIIDLPVSQTWRKGGPVLVDGTLDEEQAEDQTTQFEEVTASLISRLNLWHYCARVDRLAGLGRWGVILIGSTGIQSTTPEQALLMPLEQDNLDEDGSSIGFLRVFGEANASVARLVEDPTSERLGQPLVYDLKFKGGKRRKVHWSRIIHVAEAQLESETEGVPRLSSVLNALDDGVKVSGSSAEAYWQLAFPTWHANWDPEAELGETQAEEDAAYQEMEEDMLLAAHKARRVLMTQGVDVKNLGGASPDPRGAFDVFMRLAAAGSGIPQRVLFGSERGELASSQDWELFIDQIDDRRLQYAEPNIVRPFLDRLLEVGALPEPSNEEYALDWPDLRTRSEKEEAEVAQTRVDAMAKAGDARISGAPFTDGELREALSLPATNPELEMVEPDLEDE